MTLAARVRAMGDEDLAQEYDWVARGRPRTEHEAIAREQELAVIEGELRRRGVSWR